MRIISRTLLAAHFSHKNACGLPPQALVSLRRKDAGLGFLAVNRSLIFGNLSPQVSI